MTTNDYGVLLTNIGSPDAPTTNSVRTYLKKFLSDRRVVEIPRLIWLPILYGFILRTRPKKSAELYQKIWTNEGSPLLHNTEKLAQALQIKLNVPVQVGMHYGQPSIASALQKLAASKVKKIIALPLYPQYSATTTAATFDQMAAVLKNWRDLPAIQTIKDYHNNSVYIDLLCSTIQKHPVKHLLFSFHGIPQRFIDKGDPYAEQCLETVRLVTEKLNLPKENYSISFQSRLGRAKWLTPYTDKVLQSLPKKGIKNLHIICPGFPVDCLETLEEIAIRGKEQFLEAGGHSFDYIPAFNADDAHVTLLKSLLG